MPSRSVNHVEATRRQIGLPAFDGPRVGAPYGDCSGKHAANHPRKPTYAGGDLRGQQQHRCRQKAGPRGAGRPTTSRII